MIKKTLLALLGVLVAAALGILILGGFWSRTEHGTLDYKAAIGLKLREAFSGEEVLAPVPMREAAILRARTLQGSPVAVARVEEMGIPGPAGEIPIRVYWPSQNAPLPALVYYHGGGFVIGDPSISDSACRMLANKASAVVVSVDYRLAPEHPFPAAVEDSYAALEWVFRNSERLGVDASRIAVGGGSAGGNLTATVALMARDRGGPELSYQVMIYPVTDLLNLDTASHRAFASGYGLTREHVVFFRDAYLPEASDRKSPYASPLLAESLEGLPPAIVITAGFDVLRDEGIAYAERLAAAGVPARNAHYPTMIHGFVSMDRVFGEAEEAIDEAAAALSEAFARSAPVTPPASQSRPRSPSGP
jgi:acetyl esterase